MKKTVLSLILLVISFAFSAEVVTPMAIGCDSNDGTCYIVLESNIANTACSVKNQLRLDPNKPGSKGQYSAALAAFMAGKNIRVGLNGCHQNASAPSYLSIVK